MSSRAKRVQGGFLIWCLSGIFVVVGVMRAAFQPVENITWDYRLRSVAASSRHDSKIKIIAIDQSSLAYVSKEMGVSWPWPRSLYTPVLEFLAKAGAKGVAFDLLFTEQSNEVNDDEAFAAGIAKSLPVVSAVALQRSGTVGETELGMFRDFQRERASRIVPFFAGSRPLPFPSAALPIESILKASTALGSVTSSADADQIIRRVQPGSYLQDMPILSLPFALYAAVHRDAGSDGELLSMQTRDGDCLLRFFGPAATYDTYSLAAVISSWVRLSEGKEPSLSLDEFKDSYVFIGATAPGLLDLRSVPFRGAFPGVEVNATILDNLLHRSFLRQVPPRIASGIGVIIVGLVCLAGLLLRRGGLIAQGGLVFLWCGVCWYVAHCGWWLPFVVPVLGMSFAILATAFLQYQIEGRQHRFIRNAFRYYISPEVIERIVADPSMLRLGGERRELTIFFSDIQGFTGISERLPPDLLVQFLNRFLSEVSTIILETGGTLDKYQGDAVIAFWNAPVALEDHRRRAVLAAMRCQRRLHELASEFEQSFGVSVKMRIGIHTGVVSVGNFGSDQRFNYTMIGDAANVASRLEGVNKVFGTTVIASEQTKDDRVVGVIWRRLGDVRVVGREEPIRIYQPLDPTLDGEVVSELSVYDEAIALFEAGRLDDALRTFQRIHHDSVSRAYEARIVKMRENGSSTECVWNVKEK